MAMDGLGLLTRVVSQDRCVFKIGTNLKHTSDLYIQLGIAMSTSLFTITEALQDQSFKGILS